MRDMRLSRFWTHHPRTLWQQPVLFIGMSHVSFNKNRKGFISLQALFSKNDNFKIRRLETGG